MIIIGNTAILSKGESIYNLPPDIRNKSSNIISIEEINGREVVKLIKIKSMADFKEANKSMIKS